jgi:hypothetical protein
MRASIPALKSIDPMTQKSVLFGDQLLTQKESVMKVQTARGLEESNSTLTDYNT